MSIILDALRKSETARRRSEAPDLFTAMPTAVAPTPARPTWPLVAIGAIGVVSLIAALWLFVQRPQPIPIPTVASPSLADEAPAASGNVSPPTSPPDMQPQDAAPALGAPAASSVEAQNVPAIAATPASDPTTTSRSTSNPASDHTAVSVTIPARPDRTTATPAADAATVAQAHDVPTLPARAEPLPPPSLPPVPPPATAGNASSTALADLDPGTRSLLPPLKMSMHLWNETPSQRFVILDGQRLKEGDVVGDIVIERITRTGTVIAWRGVRIRIELH